MKRIKFVEVRSELAAGTRGASLGVDAMKVASLDKASQFFTEYEAVRVADANEKLFEKNLYPWAKHIDGVYTVVDRTQRAVAEARATGLPVVVLAGDHSTAGGTILGLKAAHPDQRMGIIWIDAHADLHTPYTTPSGNMHGMPLAMVLTEDNLDNKRNEPKTETLAYWEKIKGLVHEGPKINGSDIVFVSVRDQEPEEQALMDKYGMRNITRDEVQRMGVAQVAKEALNRLADCDIIYVSFDVDSMDTTVSVGTGTPVPDGISDAEAKELNKLLVQDPKVICWEVVEVNPTLDTKNKMGEVAFDILDATVHAMEAR
ncbi:MAG: arginase [Bacteroidota bacterium]